MTKTLFIYLFFAFYSVKSNPMEDKCTQMLSVLDKVKDACQRYPPQDYCNVFVGQATNDVYGFNDFNSITSPTGYFDANTIVTMLFTTLSDKWDNIGACDKQATLTAGQDYANSNHCVVAVWKNPDPKKSGHICLVLPGSLSAGWGGMMVPNAANFAMDAPQLNFVCKRLSGAFSSDKKASVFLFVRK